MLGARTQRKTVFSSFPRGTLIPETHGIQYNSHSTRRLTKGYSSREEELRNSVSREEGQGSNPKVMFRLRFQYI